MSRKIVWLCFVLLAIAGLPNGNFSAPQTLTKCTAQSRQLVLQKGRPVKAAGVTSGRSTTEYHVKPKSDMSVIIKIVNSQLRLDIYSLGPSTLIAKNVDNWSGPFSSGKEYILVVNNCSGKTSSRFQLLITSN